MKVVSTGTPSERKKAEKELKKFSASEYSFNPGKTPELTEQDGETELKVLEAAFDSKITPSPSPR